MVDRSRPMLGTTTIASVHWVGLAIITTQLIYLGAAASKYFNGTIMPYSLSVLLLFFGTIIALILLWLIKLTIAPKDNLMTSLTMLVYYFSTALFSFCLSNMYHDGVMAVLWVVLLATTGILFGRKIFAGGSLIMTMATLIGPIITYHQVDHLVSLVVVIIITIYVSFQFYRYREIGMIEMRGYDQLKRRERLQTRRLKAVINSLKDALISASPAGTVQLYNSSALNLLNTNRDITGANIEDLFNLVDDNNHPVKLSAITNTLKTPLERVDLRLSYGGDQYINLRLELIPIKNQFMVKAKHDLDGIIIIASDITKEKSLEDERDEFIGVVSHELRTPVAIAEGALSNLQLLVERGDDPAKFSTTLDAAHRQILYLGQMVNDLATLSRAQRGVYMNNDEINIDEFMSSLYHKYSDQAEENDLRLIADINVDGVVLVPSMVLEEIMQNLITNALKYTENGSITIGVNKIPGDKQHARFYVQDSGIGISKSDMGHLFQRFWRSEDYRTRHTSGTGLGLHVVDQLAKKIGIKIEVTSQLNVGSTFSLVLPVRHSK